MTYLILRLTSIGNVAMMVPLIASLSRRYADDRFIIVCEKRLEDMFASLPNVDLITLGKLNSVVAWRTQLRLFFDIRRRYKIDVVIDLQNVWRTRWIRMLFKMSGACVSKIENQAAEKRLLTLRGYEQLKPLKTEFERYGEALQKAGLQIDDTFLSLPCNSQAKKEIEALYGKKTGRRIAIAPFAKSATNMLPYGLIKEVIHYYAKDKRNEVFLFGAGAVESEMLRQWASVMAGVVSVAGQLTIAQELELMRTMDVMICMDSANQHLASLVGLRAVSIWLGTHPYAGYYGWKQSKNDILQKNLSCRPCTIHGKQKCRYRNFLCKDFTLEEIVEKVNI